VNAERKHPTALISYSHDDSEHEARVLDLSNRLRSDGIDCEIDLYVPGGAPPQGWTRWMEEHVQQSDFVIMVCTATYSQRVLRKEPAGIGRGVIWEANLLYNLLYNDYTFTQRAIPLLFPGGRIDFVPLPFRDNYCELDEENGYERLLQRGEASAWSSATSRAFRA
jgi:hypothetical protein